MLTQVQSPNSYPVQDQDQRQKIANNAQKANLFGYSLSADKCWITWNKHLIMWLPPEYRPSAMAVWPNESHVVSPQESSTDVLMALGSDSGRVIVLSLPRLGPYPLL